MMAIWPNLSQKTLDLLVTPHKGKSQSAGADTDSWRGPATLWHRVLQRRFTSHHLRSAFLSQSLSFPVSVTAAPSESAGRSLNTY